MQAGPWSQEKRAQARSGEEFIMNRLWKIFGATAVCLVLVLLILRITGLSPHERTPGLWLSGKLVTTPVTDWSFTQQFYSIQLQTNTWYGLPHSVTVNCMIANGHLYLVSTYPAGTHKNWDDNVMRDPHVRMKLADDLYDRTLAVVSDSAERESVLEARKNKYPNLKIAPNSTVQIYRIEDLATPPAARTGN